LRVLKKLPARALSQQFPLPLMLRLTSGHRRRGSARKAFAQYRAPQPEWNSRPGEAARFPSAISRTGMTVRPLFELVAGTCFRLPQTRDVKHPFLPPPPKKTKKQLPSPKLPIKDVCTHQQPAVQVGCGDVFPPPVGVQVSFCYITRLSSCLPVGVKSARKRLRSAIGNSPLPTRDGLRVTGDGPLCTREPPANEGQPPHNGGQPPAIEDISLATGDSPSQRGTASRQRGTAPSQRGTASRQ
jgi:hypothetical protein